jgi:hypothetical protein
VVVLKKIIRYPFDPFACGNCELYVYSQRIPQANLHTVLIFVQAKNCRHYIYYSYLKVLSVGRYCRSKCAKAYRKKVVFMLSLKIPKSKRLPFATAPKVI